MYYYVTVQQEICSFTARADEDCSLHAALQLYDQLQFQCKGAKVKLFASTVQHGPVELKVN